MSIPVTSMNAKALLGALVLSFLSILSVVAQTASCKSADDAAIRKVLDEFNDAWTARSASRYAAVFDENADWENAFGGRRKGRKEIQEFIGVLVSQFSSAEETITDTRVWCMSPKLALIDVYQTVTGQKLPSGATVPTRRIRMTQLYEKNGGEWKIKVHRVADLRQIPASVPADRPRSEE